MIVNVNVSSDLKETEVNIKAKNEYEAKLISSVIKNINSSIVGKKEDRSTVLYYLDIYYFDSIDKKTYVYTKKEFYEVNKWLNEIESIMPGNFFRCSKNAIVNLSKVKNFKAGFGGKIHMKLQNDEEIEVSRKYVKKLNELLKGGI